MSTLKVNTLTDTAATKSVPIEDVVNGPARAWVNFNGTGTVAIRAQYNVDSITDNGTGDYTVNFINALADANYCATFQAESGGWKRFESGGATASGVQVRNFNTSNTASDSAVCYVAIFR